MDNAADTIVNMLTLVARYLLLQKAQAKGEKIELEKIKVFKYIQKDVDEDGQDEVCFAAGIPGSIFAYEVGAWLIDVVKNGDATKSITVELASPDAAGFRDLQ